MWFYEKRKTFSIDDFPKSTVDLGVEAMAAKFVAELDQDLAALFDGLEPLKCGWLREQAFQVQQLRLLRQLLERVQACQSGA